MRTIKSIFKWAFYFYCVNFVLGYVSFKIQGEKKIRPICELIKVWPVHQTIWVIPGEANACLDIGVIPTTM